MLQLLRLPLLWFFWSPLGGSCELNQNKTHTHTQVTEVWYVRDCPPHSPRAVPAHGTGEDTHGGGSLTALPVIETQAGDVSAYIPTNARDAHVRGSPAGRGPWGWKDRRIERAGENKR